jgi:hypothetical protein
MPRSKTLASRPQVIDASLKLQEVRSVAQGSVERFFQAEVTGLTEPAATSARQGRGGRSGLRAVTDSRPARS